MAAASLGSAAVLAGVIQTPGLSQLFGCQPLGPVGWATAGTSAVAATAGLVGAEPVFERLAARMRPRACRLIALAQAAAADAGQ